MKSGNEGSPSWSRLWDHNDSWIKGLTNRCNRRLPPSLPLRGRGRAVVGAAEINFGEMKPHLPLPLLGRAFIASNGELAWARVDVSEAIDAYAAESIAVKGFEAWLVDRRGRWTGLLPETGTVVPAVVSVVVVERQVGERGEDYIARSKGLVLAELDRINLEKAVESRLLGSLRYNFILDQLTSPSQSSEPTLASGTSPGGQEPRRP